MVARNKAIADLIFHALKRTLAGFVVQMRINNVFNVKFLEQIRKARRGSFFVKGGKMRHADNAFPAVGGGQGKTHANNLTAVDLVIILFEKRGAGAKPAP